MPNGTTGARAFNPAVTVATGEVVAVAAVVVERPGTGGLFTAAAAAGRVGECTLKGEKM